MKYYSTNHQASDASLEEAVVKGLASDKGLYMPKAIKPLPQEFYDQIENLSFQEIAYRVADAFFGEDVPAETLKQIVYDTLSFDIPPQSSELLFLNFTDFSFRIKHIHMNTFHSEEAIGYSTTGIPRSRNQYIHLLLPFFFNEVAQQTVGEVYRETGYLLDPHGACGYRALSEGLSPSETGIFLETAHPAKFLETVEGIIGDKVEIPAKLQAFMKGTKQSVPMEKDFESFKGYLMKE